MKKIKKLIYSWLRRVLWCVELERSLTTGCVVPVSLWADNIPTADHHHSCHLHRHPPAPDQRRNHHLNIPHEIQMELRNIPAERWLTLWLQLPIPRLTDVVFNVVSYDEEESDLSQRDYQRHCTHCDCSHHSGCHCHCQADSLWMFEIMSELVGRDGAELLEHPGPARSGL